jgi:ribbon-helix-helix protein
MSRKKISTTIYVTPEQSDKLKLLHERTKVPVAVYIREGIDLVLRHYGHLLPGQLPLEGSSSGQANGQRVPTRQQEFVDTDDAERAPQSPSASAPHGGHAAHAASKK